MDNFKDTAYRIYADVQILHNNQRWFNCCYLAGYVVECYCKLVLDNAITSGIGISKSSVRDYRHGIRKMNMDLGYISASSHMLSRYCIDLNSECSTIVRSWDPNKRYQPSHFLWNQKDSADKFKQEIETVIAQIKNMQLDGVIE